MSEQQWAKALQLSRQQATRPSVSLSQQKKQNQEELQYFKNKLRQVIQKPDLKMVENSLRSLFKLRAQQMAIFLNEEQEKTGILNNEIYTIQLKKYFRDCARLTQSANILLANQHAPNASDN